MARWLAGALCVMWMVAGPATVWADDGDECERSSQSASQDGDGSSVSESNPFSVPCQTDQYDSPRHNVCYVANPIPMSTMPKWITRQQARDTVGVVLEEVQALHRPYAVDADEHVASLWQVTPPAWLDEVIRDLERQRIPFERGIMCVEGPDEEQCERLPTHAVTASGGSLTPVMRSASALEILWRPGENEIMQPPRVDLRVGPSPEFRRLPDRPPPA